ncbi:MAG: tyrosine-type recombinase/integrase [Campylobacteraceae bacterium]|nr:tyrosine-type recombinase/integrase [Campylobacteraceae bacterium]
MKYLIKNTNNIYHARIRISTQLKSYFCQREINKSLRTKNIRQAKELLKLIANEYKRLSVVTSLGIHTEEHLQSLVDDFLNRYSLSKNRTIYSQRTSRVLTHGTCLNEFEKYYRQLDIGDDKRNITLSYLKKIYLPIVGTNTLIDVIDFNKINAIKDTLSKLPRRLSAHYKTLSLNKLVKMDVEEDDRISDTTLKAYIGYTKRFYNYCLSQHYIKLNPCNSINVIGVRNAISERDPFTKEEVRELLRLIDTYSSSLHAIYYTLAHTGLRSSELWKATLRHDIDDDIWFLDLTNRKIKLKTNSSYRIVPLHKTLVDLGVPYVLPQALIEHKQERTQKVFNNSIKQQVTSSPKKVMYSLRHTFATELKYSKVDQLIISELMGHSHSGMTMGRYASRYPIHILKEAIDKLDFS